MSRHLSSFPRLLSRVRLRHKLGVSLSIAALLPVVVASWVAISVMLDGLEEGLRDETEQQLQVGLSLVLRVVGRHGREAMRLAGSEDLVAAMQVPTPAVRVVRLHEILAREAPYLPAVLIQMFDANGRQLTERVIGHGEGRFAGLGVAATAPPVRAALDYESIITLAAVGDALAVRAAAPVHDESYRLHGVVVVSVPLDGSFADRIKSDLGLDVLMFAGLGESVKPALSTFRAADGARARNIVMAPGVARLLEAGSSVLTTRDIAGREYAVGYAPLVNVAGERVGVFGVAVDRGPLLRSKSAAIRSMALGAAAALVIALLLGGLLARRLTRPIVRLHRRALAVAQGDLEHESEIDVPESDEIGDLASAFSYMTRALKENQERLAARMREIVALHDAGRAVSSVIDLDMVLRKIVDAVARVLDGRLCALWLVEEEMGDPLPGGADRGRSGEPLVLRLGAARSKDVTGRGSRHRTMYGDEVAMQAAPLSDIAAEVAMSRATLRIDVVDQDADRREAAMAAGVTGSLLATPLERKDGVLGVIIVGRATNAGPFSGADANLLATFADQAATAVENARLYEEVRAFNEELEAKVRERTVELTRANAELERALTELRETQSQLVLSERMAGLGLLVAGVAHEINSPSAAIRGSVDALRENVARLVGHAERLLAQVSDDTRRVALLDLVSEEGPALAARPMDSAVTVRRTARALAAGFEETGIPTDEARSAARRLAEIGAGQEVAARLALHIGAGADGEEGAQLLPAATGYFAEYVFLHRNALTIGNAIGRIQRIVGALKTYCHLDQEASLVEADLHEGIENTLVILDYVLRNITVVRRYGKLPRVPVYVDELNQVWTNLIHNAAQALQGRGRIIIETGCEEHGGWVRVVDDGPGIPPEVVPRIFEPFFTTKPKGEGSGLGLGIVNQIVDKHGGRVTCISRPGRTCFEVWLPRVRPQAPPASGIAGEVVPEPGGGAP